MDCFVCLEPFDQNLHVPKFLVKCGHTICNSCLINGLSQTNNRFISCPLCKRYYSLIEIGALPTNFALLNSLLQTSSSNQASSTSHTKLLTLPCSLHKPLTFQYFCTDCSEPMCSKCLLGHNRATHNIAILEDEYRRYIDRTDSELSIIRRSLQFVREGKEKFLTLLAEHQRQTKQKVENTEEKFREWMILMKEKKDHIIQTYYESSQHLDLKFKRYLKTLSDLEDQLKNRSEDLYQPSEEKMDKSEFLKLVSQITKDSSSKEELIISIKKELEEKFSIIFEEKDEQLDALFKKIIFQEYSFSDEVYPSFNQRLFEDFLEHGCELACKNLDLDSVNKTELLIKQEEPETGAEIIVKKQKKSEILFVKTEFCSQEEYSNPFPSRINFDDEETRSTLAGNTQQFPCEQKFKAIKKQEENIFNPLDLSLPPTVCLLGSNNKAIYFSSNRELPEVVTLNFTFQSDLKRSNIIKNFAACATIDKSTVFLAGGGPSNEAYLLEFTDKKNVKVKDMPKMITKRCWHGIVYLKPYVYILGGYDGATSIKSCERLNIFQANSFEQLQPMMHSRSMFGYSIVSENIIYVVGGIEVGTKSIYLDSIEKYNILENKWIQLNLRMPAKLSGLSCLSRNDDSILLIGGSDNRKKVSRSVYSFDLNKEKISERKWLPNHHNETNTMFFYRDNILISVGGNPRYNWEVINFGKKGEVMGRLFNHSNVIKSDFNNYCGFIV